MKSPWSLQRLCLCTLHCLLFAEQFCVPQLWARADWCILDPNLRVAVHTSRQSWQVAWMVIWTGCARCGPAPGNCPGPGSRVITVTRHVTRHPELSIFHAKYTRSSSQPATEAGIIMSSVQLSHKAGTDSASWWGAFPSFLTLVWRFPE